MQDNDKIGSALGRACNRAVVASESRARILQNVLASVSAPAAVRAFWTTPSFWAIVLAIIIVGLIVYGIWLPSQVSLDMFR